MPKDTISTEDEAVAFAREYGPFRVQYFPSSKVSKDSACISCAKTKGNICETLDIDGEILKKDCANAIALTLNLLGGHDREEFYPSKKRHIFSPVLALFGIERKCCSSCAYYRKLEVDSGPYCCCLCPELLHGDWEWNPIAGGYRFEYLRIDMTAKDAWLVSNSNLHKRIKHKNKFGGCIYWESADKPKKDNKE
jgi:hypothetical protein